MKLSLVVLTPGKTEGKVIPVALSHAGQLAGKIVVDTTNQFGSGPMPAVGQTAAAFNAARMPGVRYAKSFNTLTAGFQARVTRYGLRSQTRVYEGALGERD